MLKNTIKNPSNNINFANSYLFKLNKNDSTCIKSIWPNNVTTYLHNDRGQELSRTEASGTPQARTITTEWYADFNLPVRIIEQEKETVMTYDANGRLLSREVSERGCL